MNCIVTAGPTYEPLDEVRRLTNFSTGRLGAELANYLSARGHRVILLKGYYAVHHQEIEVPEVITFTTTADLRDRLRALSSTSIDAIFHAAAVNDFAFGRVFQRDSSGQLKEMRAGKFSTRQGALLAELVPTPKIISQLREWFPGSRLVGWKFEIDGRQEDAIKAGHEQMERCRTDACVVNGPAYGLGFGLLAPGGKCQAVDDSAGLFSLLAELLEQSTYEPR